MVLDLQKTNVEISCETTHRGKSGLLTLNIRVVAHLVTEDGYSPTERICFDTLDLNYTNERKYEGFSSPVTF
jgi:hypothetical protein